MKISWRPRAVEDFEIAMTAAVAKGPAEASRQKSLVENTILRLERFSELGAKTRRPGVREFAVEGTPYIVVNQRSGEDVLILRLFQAVARPA
jgi:plasmid stabilization system protein ParE